MTCTVACYGVFFPHHHVEKSAKNRVEAAAAAILRWYIPYGKSKSVMPFLKKNFWHGAYQFEVTNAYIMLSCTKSALWLFCCLFLTVKAYECRRCLVVCATMLHGHFTFLFLFQNRWKVDRQHLWLAPTTGTDVALCTCIMTVKVLLEMHIASYVF